MCLAEGHDWSLPGLKSILMTSAKYQGLLRYQNLIEKEWGSEMDSVAAFCSAITKMEGQENHYVSGD